MNFRVAVLQKRAVNKQAKKNLEVILASMKESAENGADLLLLPECFLTGYDLPITQEEALAEDSEYIQEVCRLAKIHGIGLVLTSFIKGSVLPQNTAFVIDKQGNVLMKYAKVHTCDFADESMVESGTEFKICDFDGIKIGIMICYDREYPESARILMMKGAEIILVPNDCGSMQPRIQALSTRAYENMVGVAMANPPGENAGMSCAFSPICWDREGNCIDNTLLLADDVSEGIYYVDFNMDEIRTYREREMMGNTFRKTGAYGELLNADIAYPFVRKGQDRYSS